MQREPQLDFHAVRREHLAIHDRLNNWARWCRGGRGGAGTHPMFRYHRSDNFERESQGETFKSVDTLDAADIQKLVMHIPESNRWAVQWAYCYPYIRVEKVCRYLAVSRPALVELLHDGRTMFKNQAGEEKQPRVLAKGLV